MGKLLLHSLPAETIPDLMALIVCLIFANHLAGCVLNRLEIGGLIKIASALVASQTVFTTINATFVGPS